MAGGYRNLPGDPFEDLRRKLEEAQRRIAELERPTGSQYYQSLKKLTDLVNNLAEEIENVSASGATWQGPVSAGSGDIRTSSGYVFTPAGYSFDITGTRRAAWLESTGRVGWASSSSAKKANIRDASVDAEAVLRVVARAFEYRAEIDKRDNPENPEYDPEYHVATEFGAIAEELDELGLWQVVIYEDHERPIGIHYEMLGLLAIHATKFVWAQHLKLEERVAALEEAQGL